MKQYMETSAAPRAASPVSPITLSESAYLHTRTAGAGLPALKAAIFAAGSGIFIGILTYRFWHDEWMFVSALSTVAVFLIAFTVTQKQWSRIAVGLIEMAIKADLDGRNGIGNGLKPVEEIRKKVTVDMHQTNNGFLRVTTARFEVDEQTMASLASGLLQGTPFAERHWTGSDKLLSLAQFREIRLEMLNRGMIELVNPKDPRQGFKLTYAGKAVMRDLARTSPTPPVEMS